MKNFVKIVSMIIGAAVVVVALNTVIEVMYNNSKKYFEAD